MTCDRDMCKQAEYNDLTCEECGALEGEKTNADRTGFDIMIRVKEEGVVDFARAIRNRTLDEVTQLLKDYMKQTEKERESISKSARLSAVRNLKKQVEKWKEGNELKEVRIALNRIIKYYNAAQYRPDIQRPIAWALYQTWKEFEDVFEKTDSGR